MSTGKELSLGMTVRCLDGDAGRLTRIIGDPQTQQPSYLVVRQGIVSPRDIVAPVDLVKAVTAEQVLLDTTLETFKTYPDYEVTVTKPEEPPVGDTSLWEPRRPWETLMESGPVSFKQRTVPEHTVELKRGMIVYDQVGRELGLVQAVVLNEQEHRASHLVLHRALPLSLQDEDRLVPVDLVDWNIRSHIYLSITEDQVRSLPAYRQERVSA